MIKPIQILLLLVLGITTSSIAFAAGDAEAGKAKAKTCVACHGVDGNSPNAEWPTLAGQGEAYLYKQMVELHQNNGRSNILMAPMIAELSDQDMQDLAAYYAGLTAKPGIAQDDAVVRGAAIYRGGDQAAGIPACIGCHGPAGMGNPAAKYPRLAGQHAVYTALQLKTFRSEERANDLNRMMRSVSHRMTDEEINAVSQYIAGLNKRQP